MIHKEDYSKIGTLKKTHGIKGSLVLQLEKFVIDDIPDVESVFLEINGLLAPFFLTEMIERPPDSFLLTFHEISTQEKATEYIGCDVYINSKLVTSSIDIGWKKFIDFQVIDDEKGNLGKISQILAIAENPLFQLIHEDSELYIPIHKDIITKIDNNKKIIYTHLPHGLLDVNK